MTSVIVLSLTIIVISISASSVLGYASSYCTIDDVHVSSIAPTQYDSTMVHVITTFSVSCTDGSDGTVWKVQTQVYAESNLVGVTELSTSENQYSYGQGSAQFVVNSQFDAMNYYGYSEQTPSFYVQITIINTSTGSLDAQQQMPFAVDTSQYPFTIVQQNYCNFPGLSEFFKLLPGCGGSANNTTNTNTLPNSNCNTYGLPQFLQPYLPGCGMSSSGTVPSNQSVNEQPSTQEPGGPLTLPNTSPALATSRTGFSDQSVEWLSGIVIAASATFLVAVLVAMGTSRLGKFHYRGGRNLRGKFCSGCGMYLQGFENFCERCGKPCPIDNEQVRSRRESSDI